MDNEARKRIIMDFIENNQGCTKQAVVEALNKDLSRKPVFRLVKELEDDEIISDSKDLNKPNRKGSRLFINKNNLMVTVPRELEEFERLFISFLQNNIGKSAARVNHVYPMIHRTLLSHQRKLRKTKQEKLTFDEIGSLIESHRHLRIWLRELSMALSLLVRVVQIFKEFVQFYTVRAIIEWSKKFDDTYSLNKLISNTFAKISDIQIKMIKIINSSIPFLDPAGSDTIGMSFFDVKRIFVKNIVRQRDLNEIEEFYRYFQIEDAKPLFQYVNNISKSLDKTGNHPPLHKWGLLDPSEWNLLTLQTG